MQFSELLAGISLRQWREKLVKRRSYRMHTARNQAGQTIHALCTLQ
jgi:hypothetical protein